MYGGTRSFSSNGQSGTAGVGSTGSAVVLVGACGTGQVVTNRSTRRVIPSSAGYGEETSSTAGSGRRRSDRSTRSNLVDFEIETSSSDGTALCLGCSSYTTGVGSADSAVDLILACRTSQIVAIRSTRQMKPTRSAARQSQESIAASGIARSGR